MVEAPAASSGLFGAVALITGSTIGAGMLALPAVTAPAGIATCGLMMFSLSNGTWARLVVWTAIGLVIYFSYSIRHAAPFKWSVTNDES